ncbi:hypothetical protein HX039_15480 [Myroides marinus]|uniref:hypothetical protein n=1 Tax=Myroides marinus TaxID=703342 RepID=UPI0025756235|nr:hypothetical protein [Myroides marinus]MDM1405489.1 hypothetical protein [Myroides marinus]
MKDTHILIFEHDVLKYPPILSVITFLLSQNKNVILLGYCSDKNFIEDFRKRGGNFFSMIENNVEDSVAKKLWNYFLFKKRVFKWLKTFNKENNKVWLFGEQCTWLLHKIVYKYDCNVYLFEIPSFKVNLKYRVLSRSLNYKKVLQHTTKVICCEYNRAHITKSFFQLKELPIVIPNKPNYAEVNTSNKLVETFINKYCNKKIILYQGIFNYPERRLDEFCEAIGFLPDEYILVLMGSDNDYKNYLKEKYESERIVFLPYIAAPHHLSITKCAYIGILVYNGEGGNIENTLNTLYCAPNKVYEYAKYGIPMISNDVPALSLFFGEYNNGEVLKELSTTYIREIIEKINQDYIEYSTNSSKSYSRCVSISDFNELL